MSSPTDDLLAQRQKTHGEYLEHARCTQAIVRALQKEVRYDGLPDIVKETLHMIAHKMGRIVTGNPLVKDHYDDIAGYARLVSQRIVEEGASVATTAHHPRTIGAEGMSVGELAEWHAEQARALARAAASIDDLSLGDEVQPPVKKTDPAAEAADAAWRKGGEIRRGDDHRHRAVQTPAPARPGLYERLQGARLENGPGTPEDGGHHARQTEVDPEPPRHTFTTPLGWQELRDSEGRATGEIVPNPASITREEPKPEVWVPVPDSNPQRYRLAADIRAEQRRLVPRNV